MCDDSDVVEIDRDDPTARALALLSSLTARSHWSGAELADRLGVTTRTVRRDIERLRRLGYDVEATPGAGGGYRLRSGDTAAPLFLDDDESVAVVTALMAAGGDRTVGLEGAAQRALAKLHHVLPSTTRGAVDAVRTATRSARVGPRQQVVEPRHLAVLAEACRDGIAVRFDYRARGSDVTSRRLEPHALVAVRGAWYLVGFDLDRNDWRTFRADRIVGEPVPTGHGIAPRTVPGSDPVAYVIEHLADVRYEHAATVELGVSRDEVLAARPLMSLARVTATGTSSAMVRLGATTVGEVARQVVDVLAIDGAGSGSVVTASPAVRDHLRALASALAGTTAPPAG